MTHDEMMLVAEHVGLIGPESRQDDLHAAIERFGRMMTYLQRQEIANAIEKMPFGDTAASFAAFVRGFE